MTRRQKCTKANESGFMVVWFAAGVIGVLALVTTLAIEIAHVQNASYRVRRNLDLAALNALTVFNEHHCNSVEPAACNSEKAEEARKKTVAFLSVLDSGSNGYTHTQTQIELFGDEKNSLSLVPGRMKTGAENCGGKASCFIPFTGITEVVPNAMRLSGTAAYINPISFSHLDGFGTIGVHGKSTSTLVPRRTCFLIDISASAVRKTHPHWDAIPGSNPKAPQCGQGHFFALPLKSDGTVGDTNPVINNVYSDPWQWLVREHPTDSMCSASSACPGQDPSKCAFAEDYKPFYALGDEDYSRLGDDRLFHPNPSVGKYSQGAGSWYNVDTKNSPEPLTSIIDSVHQSIGELRKLAVPGDQACLIAFDQKIGWSRMVKLTDSWDYLEKVTNFTDNTLSVADPSQSGGAPTAQVDGRKYGIRLGLFPEKNSFTDIRVALLAAANELSTSSSVAGATGFQATNQVLLFTDGEQSCKASGYCSDDDDTHATYTQGIQEILDLAQTSFSKGTLPVSIIYFGKGNMVDRAANYPDPVPDTTKPCLTDSELRSTFPKVGSLAGYFASNATIAKNTFLLSAITQGHFYPLRDQGSCVDDSTRNPANCTTAGQERTTDPFCRSLTTQVTEAAKSLVSGHPYALVESE